jgi:hypothetical protein
MTASVAVPLERLADEVQSFVQRPELRALHVAADEHLWSGALRVLLAGEYLAENRGPWLCLPVADTHAIDTWSRLEAALMREHQTRRRAGAPLSELEATVEGREGPGRCAARIRQCETSVRAPARGLTIVLVCRGASVAETWLHLLGDMMRDPVLARVRFVILTSVCPQALAWAAALPPSTHVSHRCELDPTAVTTELAAEIETEDQTGAARGTWPAKVRPPKLSRPAPAPREPTLDDTIRGCVRRSLLALRRGDGPEAVRQQARARDLSKEAGRPTDAVRMEMVLGGHLLRLQEPERACTAFGRAGKTAGELGEHALAAQACYAEAWAWRDQRRTEDALRCYWAGIEAAKRGGEVQLVFEGYWEAGQVLRPLERPSVLVSLWSDAVRYAGEHQPPVLRRTRIGDIAAGLADVLRGMRRAADARAVDEWAARVTGRSHAPGV